MPLIYKLIIISLLVWGFFSAAMYKYTKTSEVGAQIELTECIVNGKVFKIIESY